LLVLAEQLVQLVIKVTLLVLQHCMPMVVQLVVQVVMVQAVVAVVLQVMLEWVVLAQTQQVIKVNRHLRLQVHILG
jgi:hypothetical protein